MLYFTKTALTCKEICKKGTQIISEVQIKRFLFAHTAIIKVFSPKVKYHWDWYFLLHLSLMKTLL